MLAELGYICPLQSKWDECYKSLLLARDARRRELAAEPPADELDEDDDESADAEYADDWEELAETGSIKRKEWAIIPPPPKPLLFDEWVSASVLDKARRWHATLAWVRANGFERALPDIPPPDQFRFPRGVVMVPSRDYVCPTPKKWGEIEEAIALEIVRIDQHEESGPPSSIAGSWWYHSNMMYKQQRWTATLEWAMRFGFMHLIPDLKPGETYCG